MALDSVIRGVSVGTGADVDSNSNLKVNLPVNALQSGFVQDAYVRDTSTARTMRVTEEGEAYSAIGRLMFYSDFNGATMLNNQFNSQATTMASALTAGFLRLNSGLITTTNTGIAYNSARQFSLEGAQAMRFKYRVRHSNATVANKQMDLGYGMYQVAANQAGATVEFAGFRWTLGGGLIGVLEYTAGGAPTSLTVNINGGVPFSDNVTREYEVVVTVNRVEFWVGGVFQAEIVTAPDAPELFKAAAYPILARLYIGTATSLAPTFDIGEIAVSKIGPEADLPINYRQALMGRHSSYAQTGLAAATGNTAVNVASGTAPTATVGSNTAAAATGLGGFYACTATNMGTTNANTILIAYQNPATPIAAGAATHGRNLIITDLYLGPMAVTTVLVGGGSLMQWFVSIGNTAVSQATTDAAGTTAIGSKSPRIIPLSTIDSVSAAAAAGTVAARTGDSGITFSTPMIVHPGEFFSVGVRCITGTAITSGVISGGVGVSGYWD